MKKVRMSKTLAILNKTLSVFMCLAIVLSVFSLTAVAEDGTSAKSSVGTSAYDKVDMDDITGEGQNPDEITGAASSAAKKKEWYEYLTYSANPVGMYPVDDTTRILFFDPYDYTNSLIMEVDESLCDWSSANEITISYSTGNSFSDCKSDGTTSDTSVEVADGKDSTYGLSEGYSQTATQDWSQSWNESSSYTSEQSSTSSWNKTNSHSLSSQIESSVSAGVTGTISHSATVSGGVPVAEASATVGTSTSISASTTVGTSFGNESSSSSSVGGENSVSTSKTNGYSQESSVGGSLAAGESFTKDQSWTSVADRISNATGKSTSVSTEWTTNDSFTVSTTFNATYFNAAGSPLQWKIIKFSVYLPMYYIVQNKVDNEWINVGESYCLLRTIQGSCRSWIENNVVYYEHWGTGEAVTQNDFWDGFFTTDQLAEAYKNKLYPDN